MRQPGEWENCRHIQFVCHTMDAPIWSYVEAVNAWAHSICLPYDGCASASLIVEHIETGWTPVKWIMPDTVDWDADEGGPSFVDGFAGFIPTGPCEPRPQIGDLIEIPVTGGFAYALISHDQTVAPYWGPLIRVFRGVRKRRPTSFQTILRSKEQFATFTLLTEAIRMGRITVVQNIGVPAHLQRFPAFKRQVQISPRRDSNELVHLTWVVWDRTEEDDTNLPPHALTKLPRRYVDAPVKEIITSEELVQRIDSGWTPAADVPAETVDSE